MSRRKKAVPALFRPLSSKSSRSRRHLPAEDNPALQGIWHVVCLIPRGRVSSYGAVARAAGLPGRARQAGFALRVAPKALNLPWHRVVGAGGRIVFLGSPAARIMTTTEGNSFSDVLVLPRPTLPFASTASVGMR